MREAIELPFGVMSGVGPGIGVLDRSPHPQGKGRFWEFSGRLVLMAFLSSFVTEKCIRLVGEKFIIFPFVQYINRNDRNVVYCSL